MYQYRETPDGKYILIHDDHTGRVAGEDLHVEETDYDTLRSLRLKDMDGNHGRGDLILPSLEEYISICRRYEKRSILELKNHFEEKYIREIVGIVREGGQLERTVFISFDLPNMICLRALLPDQPAQFLTYGVYEGLPETLMQSRSVKPERSHRYWKALA